MIVSTREHTRLWFDVEKRYKTTADEQKKQGKALWFDVEKRYKTTLAVSPTAVVQLWFDVEKRYKTTSVTYMGITFGCGLM